MIKVFSFLSVLVNNNCINISLLIYTYNYATQHNIIFLHSNTYYAPFFVVYYKRAKGNLFFVCDKIF